MGSGSQTGWSSFFRSASPSNNATASSSRTRIEDTLPDDMQHYRDSSEAPSSFSDATATRSGNPSPQDVRQSSSVTSLDANTASDGRLHVLTERKLEKAALGKAVGLRQLVLLSNAFASRLSSGSASPSSRDALYDQNMSYGAADLEDELDRKKREEDWLDSVLDEMLTDEQEDAVPASPRDRTLYEPYVHVSINQRLAANSQWQSSDLIMPQLYHSSNFEPIQGEVSDSGFLEPAFIPLPVSVDGSPSSSASSQDSDDGKSAASADESNENTHEEAAVPDIAAEEEEELPSRSYLAHAPSPIPIESPSRSYYGAQSLAGPPTPDLAYSVNSFFSNLSSSPPTSIHLPTPASSPPVDFSSRKLYELEDEHTRDLVDLQESELALGSYDSILPMEGLDLDDLQRDVEEEESTSSSSGKSDETQKNDKPLSSIGSSLELVRYVPSLQSPNLDEAFRIPETTKRGGIFSFGPIAPTKVVTPQPPALPSPLLSTLLGRSSPTYSTRQSSVDKAVSSRKEAAKVTLPIVLPYEVVKSLYDSVDFGVPASPLHGITSPPAKSTDLATPLLNKARRSLSPPPRPAQASPTRSCPTSPRSRSKSLSNKADGIEHDSSGSLLFSSLGLYSRLASSPTRNWNQPNLPAGGDHFSIDNASLFGRDIVNEWERQRGVQFAQSRADSRSPSRLRSHLRPEDTEGDFDFGSV